LRGSTTFAAAKLSLGQQQWACRRACDSHEAILGRKDAWPSVLIKPGELGGPKQKRSISRQALVMADTTDP
jgi:hypothetical protein